VQRHFNPLAEVLEHRLFVTESDRRWMIDNRINIFGDSAFCKTVESFELYLYHFA
jgi:hypothetical protein